MGRHDLLSKHYGFTRMGSMVNVLCSGVRRNVNIMVQWSKTSQLLLSIETTPSFFVMLKIKAMLLSDEIEKASRIL